MRTNNVVLGALAALAIGAIAGILFAPEKGSKTRQQILDKGDDYADNLKSKFNKLSDSLTDKFESTKRDAERFVNKGKAKYQDAKNDMKNATSDFKHSV